MSKVKLGENTKVNIKWRVLPIDRTDEAEENIIAKFAKKYGIPKKNVTIEPVFITKNEDGEIVDYENEVCTNIQDSAFRHKLFKEYIEMNGIKDYDFKKILEIDDAIDSKIDYELYDKRAKYSIKWIKWSNFMSYGENNFFDFTKLSGLVLLTSEPANQGGKTTFCLDLFRFLLFGKVTSRETDWTLSKVFNNHIPEATDVTVEGCICIDGVDYVIKRVVSRPTLKRRTENSKVAQKLTYYKVVGGKYVELCDENAENEAGTTTKDTNKIIKDAIGNERDFDLMICVDSDNLKGLISLKDTDRGRLISRWIGLLPLEEKDKIARETFNKTIVPSLYMNKYNKEDVKNSAEELTNENVELNDSIKQNTEKRNESEKKLAEYNETRDTLLQSKQKIDEALIKADVQTVKTSLEQIKAKGKILRNEKSENEKKYEALKDVEFDETYYKNRILEDKNVTIELNNALYRHKKLCGDIETLKKGEFCPTCGARLKGVDNSAKIKECEDEVEELVKKGKQLRSTLNEISEQIKELEEKRKDYNEKVRLQLLVDKNEVDIENLLSKYRENERLLKDIKVNEEAIKNNNRIDTSINVINENIKVEKKISDDLKNEIERSKVQIESNKKDIENYLKIYEIIEKEEALVRNWKIYLEMIGKNGISKMVLRGALPLINGELKHLLNGVCDFDVEVAIDDHNDVAFYLIHDGVKSGLGSGSGFEQTVASLALRSVLSKISSFSKPSFVVFDEILGGVADENYDQVKLLYDKIVLDYAFIIQITHLKAVADWHNKIITVKKENNISRIETCEQ